MRRFTYTISKKEAGCSVQQYLKEQQGFSRKSITRAKFAEGCLLVGGIQVRSTYLLKEGDVLEITLTDTYRSNPGEVPGVRVLFEDEDVIVLEKPAGVPAHPSRAHPYDTLVNFYAEHTKGEAHPTLLRIITRLDKDTSGIVLAGKNAYAAANLTVTRKVYQAIACGEIEGQNGTIDAPIRREGEDSPRRWVFPDGKKAVTHYQMLAKGAGYTALRIWLETGRTHQIRVHFASIGHPLAGDRLYKGGESDIKRQALHCGEVTFCHPVTGREISLVSPVPEDMERLLAKIKGETEKIQA